MYSATIKAVQPDPHRTCSGYEFDVLNTDLVLLLRERIAALTQLPVIAIERARVLHYATGEHIKPHYNRCNDQASRDGAERLYRGDRMVTFLLYLNKSDVGGDVEFPQTAFRCKGAQGDTVYSARVDPQGRRDPPSLDAGLRVSSGEKWVLSQWIHNCLFGAAGAA